MTYFKDLDRIELSVGEMLNLFRWRDNNKDLVNQYQQVIPEGIIDVKGGLLIYFKFLDEMLTVYETYNDNKLICKLKTERLYDQYRILESWVDMLTVVALKSVDSSYSENDLIMDTVSTVSTCMAYIENFRSEIIISEQPVKMTRTQRRRAEWNNSHNHNKMIRLKRFVYSIPDRSRTTNPDQKRVFTRHAESWSVRGHKRNLRNGKTVWVRPYIKGKGARQAKVYKLEDLE